MKKPNKSEVLNLFITAGRILGCTVIGGVVGGVLGALCYGAVGAVGGGAASAVFNGTASLIVEPAKAAIEEIIRHHHHTFNLLHAFDHVGQDILKSSAVCAAAGAIMGTSLTGLLGAVFAITHHKKATP